MLRLGSNPPDVSGLANAAGSRNVPLEVVDIGEPEIRATYERDLVLVRPDGHVAWRENAAPTDPDALLDAVRGA